MRRSSIPVRWTIQLSSMPRRSAIGALATTVSGTAMPRPAISAPARTARRRGRRRRRRRQRRLRHGPPPARPGERASTPSRVRRTSPVRTSPGPVSRKVRAPSACIRCSVSRQSTGSVRAAARPARTSSKGAAAVEEKTGRRGRRNSTSSSARRKLSDGAGHQRRVEGAGDRQADRLDAVGAQLLAGLAERLGGAGEDDLAGGVVVGDGEAEARRRAARTASSSPPSDGDHPARVGPRRPPPSGGRG